MFKIPTYDELEKKEQEFSQKRKEFTSNLFQKRKVLNEPETRTSKSIETKNNEIPPKKVKSSPPPSIPPPSSSKIEPILINNDQNDDDDDLLLVDFISKNKDIIEKPSPSKTLNKNSSSDNLFKIPNVPVQTKTKTTSLFLKKTIETNTIKTIAQQQQVTSSGTIVGGGSSGSGGPMVVNSKQRGNPVLKNIRNVQWNFSDTLTPDYCMTRSSCALYITMKYHLLNPTYIHQRIKELGRAYDLRVLLVLCDVKEPQHCIKELEKICIFSNFTMIICWSNEEVGRYLETYKAYEFKSADLIMEKSTNQLSTHNHATNQNKDSNSDSNFINNYTDFLCQIKSVNKTDASTLRQTFGSVKNLSKASKDELNLCPGLGSLKVKRIFDTFRTPFLLPKKTHTTSISNNNELPNLDLGPCTSKEAVHR
jgi:DNA excision repair protein ERCC-1